MFLILEAPYSADFTETLKKSIPTKKRTWDANDKAWYVLRDQFDKLTHLLSEYFDETILLDFPANEVSSDSWSKMFLIKGAPVEIIQAVYRVLSKKYHPDLAGGSEEKMKELNAVYKELMAGLTNGDD